MRIFRFILIGLIIVNLSLTYTLASDQISGEIDTAVSGEGSLSTIGEGYTISTENTAFYGMSLNEEPQRYITFKNTTQGNCSLKPIIVNVVGYEYRTVKSNNNIISTKDRKRKPLASRGSFLQNQKTIKVKVLKQIDLAPIIEKHSKKFAVDPYLVMAIIKAESNFDPGAYSYAGAGGLMQLMPQTAYGLGCRDVFNPEQNIMAGTKYISGLIKQFGSLELAIAAYNAGPYNVMTYGGIPPFHQTQDYVQKVLKYYKNYTSK